MVAFENRLSFQVFLLLPGNLLHFLSPSQFLPIFISYVFAPLYCHLANRLWHAMAQLTFIQPSHSLYFSEFQRQNVRQEGRQADRQANRGERQGGDLVALAMIFFLTGLYARLLTDIWVVFLWYGCQFELQQCHPKNGTAVKQYN